MPETAGRPTSDNLALPAGGIRRPHPRLIIGGRGCGSAWSLSAMCRPEKFQESSILIRKMKMLSDMARRIIKNPILKTLILLAVLLFCSPSPACADTLHVGLPIDTSIITEPIPDSQKDSIGKIDIKWTGLEYGHQPNIWIIKGMIINGTDSELVLPIKYGQVDLTLIRDTTPLTTEEWCGTLNILRKFSRAIIPPYSIYRFSILGETGRKYSVVLETRDLQIESEEITIDRLYDHPNLQKINPSESEIEAGKLYIGYTKTSGTRTSKPTEPDDDLKFNDPKIQIKPSEDKTTK